MATTSISPEELAVLDMMGHHFTEDIVNLIWETFWWSCYVLIFLFAMYIQITKGTKSKSSIAMLVVLVYLFASSTALWGMSITVILWRIRDRMILNPEWPLDERFAYSNDHVFVFGLPEETLFLFNMLVGDAVVLWRCSVLWDRTKYVLLLPVIFLLGSFSFTIIAITCLAEDGYGTKSAIPEGSRSCQWAEPISWAFSLITNILSTSLIAYKSWKHRQFLRHHLGVKRSRSRAEKILMLLVESGFLYCFFWLLEITLFFNISRSDSAFYFYMFVASIGDQISGIYPTLIIVLVNLHHTVSEATTNTFEFDTTDTSMEFSSRDGMSTAPGTGSRSIKFASKSQVSGTGTDTTASVVPTSGSGKLPEEKRIVDEEGGS